MQQKIRVIYTGTKYLRQKPEPGKQPVKQPEPVGPGVLALRKIAEAWTRFFKPR